MFLKQVFTSVCLFFFFNILSKFHTCYSSKKLQIINLQDFPSKKVKLIKQREINRIQNLCWCWRCDFKLEIKLKRNWFHWILVQTNMLNQQTGLMSLITCWCIKYPVLLFSLVSTWCQSHWCYEAQPAASEQTFLKKQHHLLLLSWTLEHVFLFPSIYQLKTNNKTNKKNFVIFLHLLCRKMSDSL